MDRFYLGKLVDDINKGAGAALRDGLGGHLTFFLALDRELETGDGHLKMLRFLFSVDEECPVSRFLALKACLAAVCRKFSGSDYQCRFHFGHDDWVPGEEDGYTFALQFFMLEHGRDHLWNKWLVAGLIDDPEYLEGSMPRWLHYDEGLRREDLENEVLRFCQHFVSRDFNHLAQVRNLEAAFWRVVNLACVFFGLDSFEALIQRCPLRFRSALARLPDEWSVLRQEELAFSEENFAQCGRNSLRFCRQLMALEAT